jgi:GTP:adenosylcobinamide-phosphate guanylyltransferase
MTSGDWSAIVLAGTRPREDGFAEAHGVPAKALIPVAGEPMVGRVVHSLLGCPSIARIVLLAQQLEPLRSGALAWMQTEPKISLAQSGGGIARSVATYAGGAQAPFPLLVTTADHALLTPTMVEAFLAGSGSADVAVGLVERCTLETAYPDNQRTWLKFSDGAYSGANLFALRTEAARAGLELWSSIEQDRKKARKLMLRFGPILALRALTRTISLDAAIDQVGRRVGFRAQAVRLPFAEAAIDVDKPSDLELAEAILRKRGATAPGAAPLVDG